MTLEGTHSRCWAHHAKGQRKMWTRISAVPDSCKFYLRSDTPGGLQHLFTAMLRPLWAATSLPGEGRSGQPTAHSEAVGGSLVLFIYYSVFIQHLVIREEDMRRVRGVSCQKGLAHTLLTLQRPVAGYNKHLKPSPRDFHSQNHCCSQRPVPECQLRWGVLHRKCESKCRETPQGFVQRYHELSLKD